MIERRKTQNDRNSPLKRTGRRNGEFGRQNGENGRRGEIAETAHLCKFAAEATQSPTRRKSSPERRTAVAVAKRRERRIYAPRQEGRRCGDLVAAAATKFASAATRSPQRRRSCQAPVRPSRLFRRRFAGFRRCSPLSPLFAVFRPDFRVDYCRISLISVFAQISVFLPELSLSVEPCILHR